MTPDWAEAACAGYSYRHGVNPDAFFPTAERHSDPKAAAMCQRCPIIDDCLQWALRHEAWGYFGGTFPEQRQQMRRNLNIVLETPPGSLYIPPCGTEAARRRHVRRHERCTTCATADYIKRSDRKKRQKRENTA